MSQGPVDAARLRAGLSRWIREVRLAASFLTIIPVGCDSASADEVAASLGWFPLIGFALGGAVALADYLFGFVIMRSVGAVLVVAMLTAISGAMHLDGLADTADALGAGNDRTRALEILRDSRTGAFGAAAIFFVLALKVTAIASAGEYGRASALYLAPGIARWAMVTVPYRLSYLRESGAGSGLLGIYESRNLRVATVVTLIGILPLGGERALGGLIVAIVLVWMQRGFYRSWLGGVTGDLIGAAGEIIEAAVLIAVAGWRA